jgi:glycosyltransferase involved in cell wall biosynthesis
MSGKLLLVIPPVVVERNGTIEVDGDFANNLNAYLAAFATVTVACPPAPSLENGGLPNTVAVGSISGNERLSFRLLPYPYREDRYFRHRGSMVRLLAQEIDGADYLLFSPHAPLDWSTLAAKIAAAKARRYDMEADWDLENVSRTLINDSTRGLKKLRKLLWLKAHMRDYRKCLRHSSLALLQGQDVYDAYKDIAPNPHKVFNVQITRESLIPTRLLAEKVRHVAAGAPLRIGYAGRAADMKGPFDWLHILSRLAKNGIEFQATWLGDGPLLDALRHSVIQQDLEGRVRFAGKVSRDTVLAEIRNSDLFLFCHKTPESPRCLLEALASATPIVGYESRYARDLVRDGGGAFSPLNDWPGLEELVRDLNGNRPKLCDMIESALQSASRFDRDEAIQARISLIRHYLGPPGSRNRG